MLLNFLEHVTRTYASVNRVSEPSSASSPSSPPSEALPWMEELTIALLDVNFDPETPPNAMENSRAYGRRLRSWQALCVIVPLIPSRWVGSQLLVRCGIQSSVRFKRNNVALSVKLGPNLHFLPLSALGAVSDRYWRALQHLNVHTIRFYMDLFGMLLCRYVRPTFNRSTGRNEKPLPNTHARTRNATMTNGIHNSAPLQALPRGDVPGID